VFDDGTIQRLIGQLDRALVTMTTDPTQLLASSGQWDSPSLPTTSTLEHRDDVSGYSAPSTDVEQILAKVYAQVLDVECVGLDDSFFDLGGDSLSAMRAVSAIEASLGISLGLPTLFDTPTVRRLSQLVAPTP